MEYQDFFIQALIYLIAAVLSVPFAKRLGFGSVLGYLISGILIGPFILGLVGGDAEHVMHFSEFGVVMMLFLIGLELRPSILWQLRNQIIGMGSLQILGSTLFITLFYYCLDLPLLSSIAIGLILSLSSTAIVTQIFTEKGWIKTTVGKSSFSTLLFQDIAVIPIMAILPLLASTSTGQTAIQSEMSMLQGCQQGFMSIAIIGLIIMSGRFLVRPIFRYIAQSNLREIFTAAALLLVIANALAMQAIGLSPELGTFLAGVVLADNEYRHELESDIEPFKGLLLGLFFIAVGANINFNLIGNKSFLIIKMVTCLILIKASILFGISKLFKRSLHDSILYAFGLSQGSEFGFLLLTYSMKNNILDSTLANELVAVIAISMMITPMLIILFEKVIEPYFIRFQVKKEFDTIHTIDSSVLIAGFGRFGQIVGRLLLANKVKVTVLDLDSENIELIRKFGFEVFYGDASRLELLEAAGIKQAKLFILAIDDYEKALEIASLVRHHYPHLKILARVRGRTEVYEFLNRGFDSLYRETFDSSLSMGVDALKALGFPPHIAERCGRYFRKHDEESLKRLFKVYGQEKEYIYESKQSRKHLEAAFDRDKNVRAIRKDVKIVSGV